jgi:hypothetical protein
MTNRIYESRNDYLLRGETKVCPVWGHHVALVHDCTKAH